LLVYLVHSREGNFGLGRRHIAICASRSYLRVSQHKIKETAVKETKDPERELLYRPKTMGR